MNVLVLWIVSVNRMEGKCKIFNDDCMVNVCWVVGELIEKGKKNVLRIKLRIKFMSNFIS